MTDVEGKKYRYVCTAADLWIVILCYRCMVVKMKSQESSVTGTETTGG